jgi:phosphopentomutase
MGEMYINKDTTMIGKINNVYNNLSLDESLQNMEQNQTFSKSYVEKLQTKINDTMK